MTYELVRHAGPGDFLQRAESWLLASEAEHNLHLSLAYVRRDAGATGADVLDRLVVPSDNDKRLAGNGVSDRSNSCQSKRDSPSPSP